MVVTSLALSLVSSVSPVVTSLLFYISEASRTYHRTSQLHLTSSRAFPRYIIGNISHRVMAGATSAASESGTADEVIMVEEQHLAQPASPPQAQQAQPASPQQGQPQPQH